MVLLTIGTACAAPADPVNPIKLGMSAQDVRDVYGAPDRVIGTDEGDLVFYGGTLVYLMAGRVVFLSQGGEPPAVPAARRGAPAKGERSERKQAADAVASPETFPRHPVLEANLASQQSLVPARLRRAMLRASYDHLAATSWDMAIRDWAQEFWQARDGRGVVIPTGTGPGEPLTEFYPELSIDDSLRP